LPNSSQKKIHLLRHTLLATHHAHLYLPETPPYSFHIHSVHLPVKSEALLSCLTNNTDVYAETLPLSD